MTGANADIRFGSWRLKCTALITHVIGGNADSLDAQEHAMNVEGIYLTKTTDTWMVNDEMVERLEQELQELYEQLLDSDTIEA